MRKYNTDNHYLKNHASQQERKKRFTYYCDACCFGTGSISDNAKHINFPQHKRLLEAYETIQKKLDTIEKHDKKVERNTE